ncbi:hypothetical protein QYE76_005262 [Lolium multiflorum]|uniref:C2H2-type domain-containing protein n=1 Tax=Lolium multiflorum TaxID=4521 RepID=A0AAD8W101_LOLMU|nr:hypothetical protein QYE76_005262 [Lolium multiflorum]
MAAQRAGQQEPTLVMRDALLSQLHMALLRQEIIEADLAKVERDMALHAATGGQQAQITPIPMQSHGVAAMDTGRSQPWPFSSEQPMVRHNAEFDEHKLPDSNKDALLLRLHTARLRQGIIKAEVTQIESAMALGTTTSGYQTQTTQMPIAMPWHGVAAVDAGWLKPCPFNAEQTMAQQNAEFDEHKLPDSNKVVLTNKASPAEKWELTGITIPVTEPKLPRKWNCTICQVQATSEQNLQQHYDGQKHLSNVATLDPTIKASDQKVKSAAEHSLGIQQKKTSSIKWSCSTCQANGTSQSTLEAHLKGKRHQQNIAATCLEGNMDGMPKNVATQEAKSHCIDVLKNSEHPCPFITEQPMAEEFDENKLPDSNKAVPLSKTSLAEKWEQTGITIPVKLPRPPMVWNCIVCQVEAASEQDLQQHYAGKNLLSNVATQDQTTKASDQKAKTTVEPSLGTEQKKTSSIKWSCSTCQANGTSQSTLESHLKGKRHQQNIAGTSTEGDKNSMARNVAAQKWNCTMCQSKCTSETQFEGHCRSKMHQQKIQAILGKGKFAQASSSRIANEVTSHGSNSKNTGTEIEENQAAIYFCEVCNLLCDSSTKLLHHRFGKKHRTMLSAKNESS